MTAVAETYSMTGAHKKPGFRADIQGLRAIAVLLVVLYHSGVELLSGGYIGVDVFFVISGFLITTHLLEALERDGRIQFAKFYAKRVRRLLPAALLVVVLTVLASWLWMPPLLMREVFQGAVAAALYVPNILFAVQGTDYLAETAPSVFQHYWSLGIEEQFYLFWPAVLTACFLLVQKNERRLWWVVAMLTVGSFVLCIVGMGISQPWTFFSFPTRAWELGAGALVAFLMRSGAKWLSQSAVGVLVWVGIVMILGAAVLYDASTPFPSYYAVVPVVATMMMIVGGAADGNMHAGRILGLRVFQHIGAVSYSLYLVHWPLQVIPQAAAELNEPVPLWVRLLLGAVAFPLAWTLYRFVEKPVIQWKRFSLAKPIWSGIAAVCASTLVIIIAAVSHVDSSRTPLTTDRTATETRGNVSPAGTDYVPANLTPSLRTASSDNPSIYSNGCHRNTGSTDATGCQVGTNKDAPLVFLFGDSHAASWYPAFEKLADQGKIRLDVNTKSVCRSVDIDQLIDGRPYTECHQWRDAVIKRINAERADLVVLSNFAYETASLSGGSEDIGSRWRDGLLSTVGAISGSKVAVIADVPHFGSTPAICLSANLENANTCAVTTSEAFSSDIKSAEQAAIQQTHAEYWDFTEYLCNDAKCPPIIGDTLVYRDGHHLTEHFSQQMIDPLWQKISS